MNKLLVLLLIAAPCYGQQIDNPKPKVVLAITQASLAFADTGYTQSLRPRLVEHDFLAKPVVKHAGLAYGLAGAEVVFFWFSLARPAHEAIGEVA